ncbi:MAG TPA: cytochrome P450, partial [Bryobacteraceae bacterium]|nr:cytochrome P450 [Bryobacteraceae bacterium]
MTQTELGPRPPFFEPAIQAWVLTRYPDVLGALSQPLLVAGGSGGAQRGSDGDFRLSSRRCLSPASMAAWQSHLKTYAAGMTDHLPGEPYDLVTRCLQPFGIAAAAIVCDISCGLALQLDSAARVLLAAASDPLNRSHDVEAKTAASELGERLRGKLEPLGVQAFVALSQTLPCFLAGACLALLHDRDQLETLWRDSSLMSNAVEELLRVAGPSRALLRYATAPISIADVAIPANGRVALMLRSANRDPSRFSNPDRIDFKRDASGH